MMYMFHMYSSIHYLLLLGLAEVKMLRLEMLPFDLSGSVLDLSQQCMIDKLKVMCMFKYHCFLFQQHVHQCHGSSLSKLVYQGKCNLLQLVIVSFDLFPFCLLAKATIHTCMHDSQLGLYIALYMYVLLTHTDFHPFLEAHLKELFSWGESSNGDWTNPAL